MMARLSAWMHGLAHKPSAPYALGAVSFAESSFFPLPPDLLLAPMALARPEQAWRYAAICTIASVLGGLAGYAIGALFYQTVGVWLIGLYGGAEKVESLLALYREYGALLILIKGLTPIPYKFVTIASGVAGYDLLWFVVLSALTRGVRFYAVAGAMNLFGPRIRVIMDQHGGKVVLALLVLIIGGFFALKWLL